MSGADHHRPVLLEPAVDALVTDRAGHYLDGTFGRGGHSRCILERLSDEARLRGLDRDPAAAAAAAELAAEDPRFSFARGVFSAMASTAADLAPLSGVLLDIGVSSPQLDEAARGFSFQKDGPLDMRMDPETGASAADWLAAAAADDIARVLRDYGEERHARRIARAIKAAPKPPATTTELAELVAAAAPLTERHKHPATRTFQALRIQVNDELGELDRALAAAFELLAPGGRLVVISFHSLEDRCVKRFIRAQGQPPGNRRLPPAAASGKPGLRALGKPRRADAEECRENPRARSAVLRVAEKVLL
ncbi:MAG: 16S rRNA (cytosine(1402)-N(4))-methyltransferase RsmH [Pseudomonadota bacterium]